MKVLHIVPSLSLVRGGPTIAVLETVKALRDSGVNAAAIATNDNGDRILDVPLNEWVDYHDIPARFFPRSPSPIKAFSEFSIALQLTDWLRENIRNYDLIEINSLFSYACTFSARIARQQNIPYVISPHGHFSPWVIGQKRWKKRIYNFLLEQKNLDRATAIHCTTEDEAKYTKNFGVRAPTFVVPLGVRSPMDLPNARQKLRDRFGISPDIPIILFLSRLHPKKRPDFLLQVLDRVAKQHDFHLLLAGSGDETYVKSIANLVSSLKLSDRVTMPGFVTGEDKDRLLLGSDLFVLPSYGENFGIAVAEAAIAGLPAIITPEVELRGDIRDRQAGIVVPGEIDPWVEAISKLLTSPQLCREMGENGRQLATQRYNWSAVGKQLAEIYIDLV